MAKQDSGSLPQGPTADDTGAQEILDPVVKIQPNEFESAFGEKLSATLDLDTWQPGENLASLYGRLEREVEEAIRHENRIKEAIREKIFPLLKSRPEAPKSAGIFQASVKEIEKVHTGLLFNGGVEGCDGISVPFDTLPLTIIQIGVCLVSYAGDQGSWVHRLYRRDLRVSGLDPVEEAFEILERRRKRSSVDVNGKRDKLSDLGRRGIMAFAERAVLLRKSKALWRMGHGSPAPYEMLTGSGMADLLQQSLDLLEDMMSNQKRFVFVPSAPSERLILTIGNALYPLEYAIIDTLKERIAKITEQGHFRGEWAPLEKRVQAFANDGGSKIVVGTFRASPLSPAHMFYAHEDYAHQAALIALADSTLQEHRGFPMLIDLADTVCRGTFGADSLLGPTQQAYAEAGEPFRYLSERSTRR